MRVCPKRAGPDVWIPADISGPPGCRAAAGPVTARTRGPPGGGSRLAVFSERHAGTVTLVNFFRAAVGEFVRGSRDRDLVAYYDSDNETISRHARGLAVRCRPGCGRCGPGPRARWR